jgi:hypothetical protein
MRFLICAPRVPLLLNERERIFVDYFVCDVLARNDAGRIPPNWWTSGC